MREKESVLCRFKVRHIRPTNSHLFTYPGYLNQNQVVLKSNVYGSGQIIIHRCLFVFSPVVCFTLNSLFRFFSLYMPFLILAMALYIRTGEARQASPIPLSEA